MLEKLVPGTSPDGTPILSLLGKETFSIKNGEIAEVDYENAIDFIESDEYWDGGAPATHPVKYESDTVAFKPMTDVVFHGSACAPQGKKARFFDLSVGVGQNIKTIRVLGNRKVRKTLTGFEFTEPELFEEMPLHYGLAYGGKDTTSDEGIEYTYPKNTVGKGYVVKEDAKTLHELELPNIEDPHNLLTPKNLIVKKQENWIDMPEPVGFGFLNRSSYPRYTFSGLPFEQYLDNQEQRSQQLAQGVPPESLGEAPPMLNHLFFNGASAGLRMPYLKGAEKITMMYMDKEHPKFQFQLPGINPVAWIDVGEGKEEMPMVIHTVEVHKPTNQLTIVWRGASFYGGPESLKDIECFEFGVDS